MESLPVGLSRETQIVLDAHGRWWNEGERIEHANVERAFFSWIQRHEDGRYILLNSINWAYITVLGAPLFVEACELKGDSVHLILSGDSKEELDPSTLVEKEGGALWCAVRSGKLNAEFRAHAMQQLAPLLEEVGGRVGLRLGGSLWFPRSKT